MEVVFHFGMIVVLNMILQEDLLFLCSQLLSLPFLSQVYLRIGLFLTSKF